MVFFDLLCLGSRDLTRTLRRRRTALEKPWQASRPSALTPATRDRKTPRLFRRFEGAGLDGVIASPRCAYERAALMLKVSPIATAIRRRGVPLAKRPRHGGGLAPSRAVLRRGRSHVGACASLPMDIGVTLPLPAPHRIRSEARGGPSSGYTCRRIPASGSLVRRSWSQGKTFPGSRCGQSRLRWPPTTSGHSLRTLRNSAAGAATSDPRLQLGPARVVPRTTGQIFRPELTRFAGRGGSNSRVDDSGAAPRPSGPPRFPQGPYMAHPFPG